LAAGPSPAVGFATVTSPQEMQAFFQSRSTTPGSAGSPKPAARRRQRCVRPLPMAFGLGGRRGACGQGPKSVVGSSGTRQGRAQNPRASQGDGGGVSGKAINNRSVSPEAAIAGKPLDEGVRGLCPACPRFGKEVVDLHPLAHGHVTGDRGTKGRALGKNSSLHLAVGCSQVEKAQVRVKGTILAQPRHKARG
jgi:hypothetical protein